MRFSARRVLFCNCLVFALLLNISSVAANVPEFQIDSTNVQVYRDGLVRVTQTLESQVQKQGDLWFQLQP